MAQIRMAILAIFCCAFTAVNAQQKVQVDSVLTPVSIANDEPGAFYAEVVKGSGNGNFKFGFERINFYTASGFSGRMLVDLNFGAFDNEGLFGFRFGYNLGYNIFPILSVHALAALGAGFYSGIEKGKSMFGSSTEEDSFFPLNALTLSCGSAVNFSYFYPITLYLKAEVFGLTGGGLYSGVGGGVRYALKSKK